MSEELDKETNQLIKNLEDPENAEEVKNVQLTNPMEELGRDIFSFFKQRISHIGKISDFKEKVKEKLLEKLNSNPDISFSEISRLFLDLTEQETFAAQQVVSLLKPPQGSPLNPIVGAMQPKDKPMITETGYNVDTQRKIDTIYRFFEAIDQKSKKEDSSI